MGLQDLVFSDEGRALLLRRSAADFLHGCVRTQALPGGWVRPWRVTERQLRVLGSCMAWHPGLYRRMARSTAGVCLRFRTDANEMVLALRPDVWNGKCADPVLGLVVDGQHLGPVEAQAVPDGISGVDGSAGCSLASLRLDAADDAPGPGMVPLPGFGRVRDVTVFLPYVVGCAVRELWCDGQTVEAVPPAPVLAVVGDSISQGCYVHDPSRSWTALLAQELGMDLWNLSIDGQVFQPEFAADFASLEPPAMAVVALGTNYRFERCGATLVRRDVRGLLGLMAQTWPEVPTYVWTPPAHDEAVYPTHRQSCYAEVPRIIRAAASVHPQQHVVEGTRLLGPADLGLLDDADHPAEAGHQQMARRMAVLVRAGQLGGQQLRQRADAALDAAPPCALGVRESLERHVGQLLYADRDDVLVRLPRGRRAFFGTQAPQAAAVLGALCAGPDVREVLACGRGMGQAARDALGMDSVEPVVLAFWRRRAKVKVSAQLRRQIRPLGAEHQQEVVRHVGPAQRVDAAWARELLASGGVLGAFEKDELVGFVGELPDGSIGMLQVFAGHKTRGWAAALVAAKANEFVAKGQHPWIVAYPYQKALVKRLRELGFELSPATEQCVLCRGGSWGAGADRADDGDADQVGVSVKHDESEEANA